ncbi:hypothetical protein [Halomonas denitrificans]|nr:hypothetical protein [Halomonas denitrificans]
MSMNREHALELLTLLAVIAIVHVPLDDSDRSSARTGSADRVSAAEPIDRAPGGNPWLASTRSSPAMANERPPSGPAAPHRLDPLGLLQASVPDTWRVAIPVARAAPLHEIRNRSGSRPPPAIEARPDMTC